ncbi:MAG TPA: hypothetical protein PLU22_08860 [Polyangiaceae bacterium]|nr:hypothetical protein [Polyangiaceae bacterium]
MTRGDEAPSERCPHCGSVAELEPARLLRHRCRVCGGPRVPRDGREVAVTRAESTALGRARRRSFARAAWLTGALAAGSFGSLALLVTLGVLALAQPGWSVALGAVAIAVAPTLLSLYAAARARAARRAIESDLDEAELAVARGVAERAAPGLTASDLALALRREERDAERLLARLAALDLVRARVTEEGTVVFEGLAPRVRVQANPEAELTSSPAPLEGEDAAVDAAAPEPPRTAADSPRRG